MSKVRYWMKVAKDLMSGLNQLKRQYNQFKNSGTQSQVANNITSAAEPGRLEKHEAPSPAQPSKSGSQSLPVTGLTDARLEAEFKQLGQLAIGNSFAIEKINITASKWGITNDNIGRPISRSMITVATGKDTEGECYQQYMTFTQQVDNEGYGPTFYNADWSYTKKKIKNH